MRPHRVHPPCLSLRPALLAVVLWSALIGPAGAQPPPALPPAPGSVTTLPAACPAPAARKRPVALPVHAAVLGDRQRMVQVAMIFMGIAILILVRGNKF